MSEDYIRGQRDGLRLALGRVDSVGVKWEPLVGDSSAWRSNLSREVRYKALQVAHKRVQRVMNRLLFRGTRSLDAELTSALEKLGLSL